MNGAHTQPLCGSTYIQRERERECAQKKKNLAEESEKETKDQNAKYTFTGTYIDRLNDAGIKRMLKETYAPTRNDHIIYVNCENT